MWKYSPFVGFLNQLVEHDKIGEIIIVNNDFSNTPQERVLHHPKIRMHNFKFNIFVNPAWNYGVGVSQYDKLCILSDDVLFDLRLLDLLSIELVKGRLIVNSPEPPNSSHVVTGNFRLVPGTDAPWEFGSLMFITKCDWINIPAGLDLFHGDSWMWDTMKIRYGTNYMIKDLHFYTPRSVTVSNLPNRESIYIDRECKLYSVLLDNYKRNRA